MASGMARGAAARGKRIALGDGSKIIWDQNSELVFRDNPNIAKPGSEKAKDIEWIAYYRGNRIYGRQEGGKWVWNYDFRPTPGEIFLNKSELEFGRKVGKGFVVIEPNVPGFKSVAPNKQWPVDRYAEVGRQLKKAGFEVVQLVYPNAKHRIAEAHLIGTPNYRLALSILKQAALYIGPEGGLHHGSAAVGTNAIVMFGGFVPPQVTGYEGHTNLTGNAQACGSINPCPHCKAAMDAISVEQVMQSALVSMQAKAA